MTIEVLPDQIKDDYEIYEWKHACSILKQDFPNELQDIIDVLTNFKLKKSDIVQPGGGRSPITKSIDTEFYYRGWEEKPFNTRIVVDENEYDTPTHKIDCFKNKVGIEIEWNNKDPFYDRDLNNFRLLFELRALSVGVIITRSDELQEIFDKLGKGKSYGSSTTHWSKLIPRIEGGGASGCPVLAFGISKKLYKENE